MNPRFTRHATLLAAAAFCAACGSVPPRPDRPTTPAEQRSAPAISADAPRVLLRGRLPVGSAWRLHEVQGFEDSGETRETRLLATWTEVDPRGSARAGTVALERLRAGGPSPYEGLVLDVAFEGATPRLLLRDEGRGRDLSAELLDVRARLRVLSGRSVLLPRGDEPVAVGSSWDVPGYEYLSAAGLLEAFERPRGGVHVTLQSHDPQRELAVVAYVVHLEAAGGLVFHWEGSAEFDVRTSLPREETSRGWIRAGAAREHRVTRRTTIEEVPANGVSEDRDGSVEARGERRRGGEG